MKRAKDINFAATSIPYLSELRSYVPQCKRTLLGFLSFEGIKYQVISEMRAQGKDCIQDRLVAYALLCRLHHGVTFFIIMSFNMIVALQWPPA